MDPTPTPKPVDLPNYLTCPTKRDDADPHQHALAHVIRRHMVRTPKAPKVRRHFKARKQSKQSRRWSPQQPYVS
jgi:hypothetical protein